jgi:glycerol-3-phosphate dehydrogenase
MSWMRHWPQAHDGQAFDLLVVGGGATGLGVALEAAQRGLDVALYESHDFASGTSSRSTKLLHGGVRYLAQGHLSLVREALRERKAVLQLAPHLAQALPFVMPSYRAWQQPFYGAGLMLYDWLAGRAGLGHTRWLGREATLHALPGLQAQGLRGSVQYWDGQFEDARLAIALARTAQNAGAQLRNHTEVSDLQPSPHGHQVRLLDRLSGQSATVQARCVVNAAGVWVDRLRQRPSAPQPHPDKLVSPSQGVHLVVDRSFLPGPRAVLVPRTRDGRMLFAVPWLGRLILGTTDTPRSDLPREPTALAEERDFILREASAVLARPVQLSDVRSQWVGLRPLVASSASAGQASAQRSREHTLVEDADGLLTVVGGKWTTFRAMALEVVEHGMRRGLLPQRPAGQRQMPLWGAPPSEQAQPGLHEAPGLHLYGTQAHKVLACAGAQRLLGLGLSEAMVRYAVREEYACTVEDVLARRWRALFLDAREALRMAPAVAEIMQQEGVHEPDLAGFGALCRHYLPLPD